jgi:hypothetical protein
MIGGIGGLAPRRYVVAVIIARDRPLDPTGVPGA